MSSQDISFVHTGTVVEEDSLSLGQLCHACGVHADWIISLVEESIIEPKRRTEAIQSWRFSGACLNRARSTVRLHRDLGVNLAGIALALDLLEEVDTLRARITLMGLPHE